jgi:hypothetical protein
MYVSAKVAGLSVMVVQRAETFTDLGTAGNNYLVDT